MAPDLCATDVDYWSWFSQLTFKYLGQFLLIYLFFADMQLEKCSFNTSPELQHDKSLAVSLLTEI